MYYLYIIESEISGKLYIGQTNDLEDRLKRHTDGRNKYTKGRGPWKLLFSKKYFTRTESYKIEQILKSWKSPKRVREWILKECS